jgi:hypothetical protein
MSVQVTYVHTYVEDAAYMKHTYYEGGFVAH